MSLKKTVALWVMCAIGTVIAIAVSMHWLDEPIARAFLPNMRRYSLVGRGLGSAVLVSGELILMAALVAVRITSGHLQPFGKAALVALVASLTAFSVNDAVLKILFGVASPGPFLFGGADHAFHFFQGNLESSFPSGHMALAASFAFAFSRLYRKAWPGLLTALFLAGLGLIIGDWHFLSDVISGVFVGATAGLTAGELWLQHVAKRSS